MSEPASGRGGSALGAGLIAISAAAFATLPIFGKLAYASGTEPFALLAWRFAIASVILVVTMVIRARIRHVPLFPPLRLSLTLLALGAFLLTPEVILFFVGLQTVSAGLAETLLYLYPAWVVLIAAVVFRRKPSGITVACVAVAIVGAAITVGAAAAGSVASASWVGVAEVVGCSVLFATYLVVASRVLPRAGALPSTALVMTGAAATFVLLAVITGSRSPSDPQGWLGVLGMALIGTVVAFGLLSIGLARIAPSTAAVISTIEPVVAVVLGAVVLGETVGWAQIAGMALILGSVAVLLWFESRAGGEGQGALVNPVAALE